MRFRQKQLHDFLFLIFYYVILIDARSSPSAPRVVRFPLEKQQRPEFSTANVASQLMRREAQEVSIYRRSFASKYLVNITVGTPPQKIKAILDTGSSRMLVPSASSPCNIEEYECPNRSAYNQNASSSYHPAGDGGYREFAFSDTYRAKPVLDVVTLGQFRLPNATVFVTDKLAQGILGVAFAKEEDGDRSLGKIDNFLQGLKITGAIKSKSLSVNLDENGQTGSVIFGGLDAGKFIPPLRTVPMPTFTRDDNSTITLSAINVTSIKLQNGKNAPPQEILSQNISMLLDTGASLMTLPQSMYNTLLSSFDTTQKQYDPFRSLSCEEKISNKTLTFEIGGPSGIKIVVPVADFIDGPFTRGGNSTEVWCDLLVLPADDGDIISILGDPFFVSNYVVFDYENEQFGFAKNNHNATGSQIQEIISASGLAASGFSGIPLANSGSYD